MAKEMKPSNGVRPNILGTSALIAYPLVFLVGLGNGRVPIAAARWSATYGSILFVALVLLGRFVYRKRLRDLDGDVD